MSDVEQKVEQNVRGNILTAQQRAIELWNADREVFGRSQDSAKALGAALVEVKTAMPHGDFKPWLKAQGIDRNRATYCMRVSNGKDAAAAAAKAKQATAHVTTLKLGMLVRWEKEAAVKVVGVDKTADRLTLLTELAPEQQQQDVPQEDGEAAPAPEQPYDGPPKVEFDAAELNKVVRRLGEVCKNTSDAERLVRITSPAPCGEALVGMVGTDASLSVTVAARTIGNCNLVIQYDELAPAIKNLADRVTLTDDGTLLSGTLTTKLKCWPAHKELSDFPIEDTVHHIDGINLAGLKEQYKLVDFAIPAFDGKFVVRTAQLASSNGTLRMAATDHISVALSERPGMHGDFNFTIPQPALELLHKMNGEILDITETEHFWRFSTKRETLVYAKNYAEFPPFERVIPPHHDGWTKITVDAGAIASALKRLLPHAIDKAKPSAYFVTDGDQLLIGTERAEKVRDPMGFTYEALRVTASASVKALSNASVEVTLDMNRVLPFLGRVKGDVELYVKDAGTLVDCLGPDGFRFLVMPMRRGASDDYAAAKARHELAQSAVVAAS